MYPIYRSDTFRAQAGYIGKVCNISKCIQPVFGHMGKLERHWECDARTQAEYILGTFEMYSTCFGPGEL